MKQITFILGSPPYGGQDTDTVIGISKAALKKGHRVSVVASGDGTYAFLKGQKASGVPNAEEDFANLIERGLQVSL